MAMDVFAEESYNRKLISNFSEKLPKTQSMWEKVLHQSREKEKQKFGEQKAKTLKHFLRKGEDDTLDSKYHRRSISELIIEWELLQSQFAVASDRLEMAIRTSKQRWSYIKNNNLSLNNEIINFGETCVFDSSEFKPDSFELVKDALHRNSSKPLALLCGLYGSDHKLISSPTDVIAVAILGDNGEPFLGIQINYRPGMETDTPSMLGVKRAVCFVGRMVVMEKIINITENKPIIDKTENNQQDSLDLFGICSDILDNIINKIEVCHSLPTDYSLHAENSEQDIYFIGCVWDTDETENDTESVINVIKDTDDVKNKENKEEVAVDVNDDDDDSVIIWDEGIQKTWRSRSSSENSYDITTSIDDLSEEGMKGIDNDIYSTWIIVEGGGGNTTTTSTSPLSPKLPLPVNLSDFLDSVKIWWHNRKVVDDKSC